MPIPHRILAATLAVARSTSEPFRRLVTGDNDHAIRNASAHRRIRQDANRQVAALEGRVQTTY